MIDDARKSGAGVITGKSRRLIGVLLVSSVLLAIFTLVFYSILILRFYMIWNVFLAALPLFFTVLFLHSTGNNRGLPLSVILFLLWLFFLPNAPYMLTDFIHVNLHSYYQHGIGHTTELAPWIGLVHLIFGILIGCLYGYLSLYFMHMHVRSRFGKAGGWGFVAVISGLCGIGIYLGRFLRFNTWDLITRPFSILGSVWQAMISEQMVLFILLAAMTLIGYLFFYFCFSEKDQFE